MKNSQIGVYGLGVMGRNLALNLETHGYSVSVFNRSVPSEETVVRDFITNEAKGKNIYGADSLKSFIYSLESPRKIMLVIKAGKPVDHVLASLLSYFNRGDIIIDAGNSHYKDTVRRLRELEVLGVQYVGMGVSGGEYGARFGPSLMPGGNSEAWPELEPILTKISAKAFDGSPCCTWLGNEGAGHLVKMIHNGIEYAEMQILAESYHLLKETLGWSANKIGELFSKWNKGYLNSYLLEISANIMKVTDDDGQPLVEKILDSAEEKGTGKWTAIEALENGIPAPGISQSVIARYISNYLELRKRVSTRPKPFKQRSDNHSDIIQNLEKAIYASRLSAYAEGFFLISKLAESFKWEIDLSSVARIWQGGCIVRSELLKSIEKKFILNPELNHLFLAPDYIEKLDNLQNAWRSVVVHAIQSKIPVPCMSAYLSLYDSLCTKSLPANLIQAQRDYFGAHQYERIDYERGQFFHTDWSNH